MAETIQHGGMYILGKDSPQDELTTTTALRGTSNLTVLTEGQ